MFVFEAIAGGILFDGVKEGLNITTKFVKKKLKKSILESLTDEDLVTIVNEINGLSDEKKENIEKFKESVNSNPKLLELLSNIKDAQQSPDNKINISNSVVSQSPIINNSEGDINIIYGEK